MTVKSQHPGTNQTYFITFTCHKPDYIHYNPVRGKWRLAETPEDYPYSSAKFYFTGEQRRVTVTHYREAGIFETEKNEA